MSRNVSIGEELQPLGSSLYFDTRHPNVPLHGTEILPTADFLNLDRRDTVSNELCCETRSQGMEPNRRKAHPEAEPAKFLRLEVLSPLPKPWQHLRPTT